MSFRNARELVVAVTGKALAEKFTGQGVERSKQCGGAVALVVMGDSPGFACFHGQARLGAIESLYLGFLVEGEHDRVLRRAHVEPDDIDQLVLEVRIV